MEFNVSSPPNRRFLLRLAVFVVVFGVSIKAAEHLIGQGHVDGVLAWALALMPGLAFTGIFYAYGMLIVEQKDEFIRMLVLRQLVIATGIALSYATVWGFLEHFALVAHADSYWVAVAWILGFAFGGVVNRITHGAAGEMS